MHPRPGLLPRRCSAVETPDNGHLTDQYGSCKFSRHLLGRPDAGATNLRFTLDRQRRTSNGPLSISTGSQGEHNGLPPTPFISGRNPIPPLGHRRAHYQTSTYINEELGKNKGYDTREPTSEPQSPGTHCCQLEWTQLLRFLFRNGGDRRRLRLLRPGRHVVLSEAVYVACSVSRRNFGFTSDWSSASWTRPCLTLCVRRYAPTRK